MGDYRLVTCSTGTYEDAEVKLVIRSPMDLNLFQDSHDQTLRATRVSRFPDSASAAVSTAAVPEGTNQLAANTAAILKRVNQRISVTAVPTMPIIPKRQSTWIDYRAL